MNTLTLYWNAIFIMVIGYARVSTWDQELSAQVDALNKYGCEKIFQEKESSRLELKERDRMLSFVREGDKIVVYKLDRFGRSMREHLELMNDLKEQQIEFISITESIDTTSPIGKFFFHMMAALSEFERDQIRERTKEGLAARRRAGVTLGRPRGIPKAKQDQAKILWKMHQDERLSVNYICEAHNVKKPTYYRRIDWASREESLGSIWA